MRETGIIDGYGRLVAGTSVVVADSGAVPPPEYALQRPLERAELRVQPRQRPHRRQLRPGAGRQTRTRNTSARASPTPRPTINSISANPIRMSGAFAGRLVQHGEAAQILADEDEDTVVMRTHGYADRFGVVIERRLTLIAEGKSLVGQDKFFSVANKVTGTCAIRFHLAGTSEVEQADDLVRIRTASGAVVELPLGRRPPPHRGQHAPVRLLRLPQDPAARPHRPGRRGQRGLVDFHA